MKKLYILFLIFVPLMVYADVYKCANSGRGTYSDSFCASGYAPYTSRDNGASSVVVNRGANGAYNVSGSVNNLPVSFILDTGASRTVISGRVAYALGVRSCQVAGYTSTANGASANCVIRLSSLSVAGFQFDNVDVVVSPNMELDALLGNDLLARFHVEQNGGVMTLSR